MAFPFTVTRNQIIKRALRIVGVLAQGEEPTPEQLTEANECISATLKALSNDGVNLWKQTERRIDFATAASQCTNGGKTYLCLRSHTSASTTEPGVGANWHLYWKEHSNSSTTAWVDATAYTGNAIIEIPDSVIYIDKLWSVENGSDSPITLVNRFDFLDLSYKYDPGDPQQAWFEAAETPLLHLDYSPDANSLSLRYLSQTFIDSFAGAGDTQDTPGQWVDALCYAVASQLADEYQLALEERSYLTQKAIAKVRSARGATRDTRTGSFVRNAY